MTSDPLGLARPAEPEEILARVPFVASTLVDCLTEPYRDIPAATDETPRAQRVAQEAWGLCRDLGATSPELAKQLVHHVGFRADSGWLCIFDMARLDLQGVAEVLLEWHRGSADPRIQGKALCIRGWVEEPQVVLPDWLGWVRERLAAGEAAMVLDFRWEILRGPWLRFGWRAAHLIAQETWEVLRRSDAPDAQKQLLTWSRARLDPSGPIKAGEWAEAEEITRRQIQELGLREGSYWAITLAAARGVASPPELVQAVEEGGIEAIDEYGMTGSYLVAREAAAAGNEAKAFDALRKALSYWTNPPYANMATWENDAYWGALRERPEFRGAFEERRRRIGPVYGFLHYFPGW